MQVLTVLKALTTMHSIKLSYLEKVSAVKDAVDTPPDSKQCICKGGNSLIQFFHFDETFLC